MLMAVSQPRRSNGLFGREPLGLGVRLKVIPKEVTKMKKSLNLKLITMTALVAVLIGALGGCAKPDGPAVSGPAPEVSTPAPEVSSPAPEVTLPAPSAKIADQAADAEGVYNGQIDNNSIEIQMSPTDIVAFRTTEVQDQLKELEDGDRVKFGYKPNADGQLVLTFIEKLE
jgi:hypothetical protein